jgi:hypothetical protein
MGPQPNEVVLAEADRVLDDTKGEIILSPNFKNDYYEMINEKAS